MLPSSWRERMAYLLGACLAAGFASACDALVGVVSLSAGDGGPPSPTTQCSPMNCGGTCVPSGCLVTLASGQGSTINIHPAVDSTSFYFAAYGSGESSSGGIVAKVGLDGGAPIPLDQGLTNPSGLAIFGTSLYWVNDGVPFSGPGGPNGAVMLQALSSSEPPVALATTAASAPYGLATDAMFVYWADNGAGTVMKAPLAGGPPTMLASGQVNPQNIAVDATNVYWINAGSPGAVMKVALEGDPSPVTLAPAQDYPNDLVTDGTSVYWTNADGPAGTVMKVAASGGAPIPIATGVGDPEGIAVSGDNVYFTTYGSSGGTMADGTVESVGLDGLITTLATGQNGPNEIAVVGTSVYWTTADGNAVKLTPMGRL
jgi:hypothetical protein